MPRHDQLDLARVLLARSLDDQTLVRKVGPDTEIADAIIGFHAQQAGEALKRRVAELLVECRTSPHVGELMGSGRHPELADCRRVRFDIPAHHGASLASGSSTATSHQTAPPRNAAGSPSRRARVFAHTAKPASARAESVEVAKHSREHRRPGRPAD